MNSFQPDILQTIVAKKRQEIAHARKRTSVRQLERLAMEEAPPRGFEVALRKKPRGVIAEIKKASPSQGVICEDFHPAQIAQGYEKAGAACLSVLTDVSFFQGSKKYLIEAKKASSLPILRKDFMLDPYQIVESRALGADCVLLIVACLSDMQLQELHQNARELGMDVLVEVHTEAELERALQLPNIMIGINNRNLKTFKTTLNTSLRLKMMIPASRLVISESGIHTAEDLKLLTSNQIRHFLIGEQFMKTPDAGLALEQMLQRYQQLKL